MTHLLIFARWSGTSAGSSSSITITPMRFQPYAYEMPTSATVTEWCTCISTKSLRLCSSKTESAACAYRLAYGT